MEGAPPTFLRKRPRALLPVHILERGRPKPQQLSCFAHLGRSFEIGDEGSRTMGIQFLRRAVLFGIALGAMVGRADAVFTVTFNWVGNDLVAAGSGSLRTAGIESNAGAPNSVNPYVDPRNGSSLIVLGNQGSVGTQYNNVYFLNTLGFGSGFPVSSDFGAGSPVALFIAGNSIILPMNYASGDFIQSSATFRNARTFLSLTPGTYVYAYAASRNGPEIDRFVIQINGAVPEPASLAMLGVALAGVGVAARRKGRN